MAKGVGFLGFRSSTRDSFSSGVFVGMCVCGTSHCGERGDFFFFCCCCVHVDFLPVREARQLLFVRRAPLRAALYVRIPVGPVAVGPVASASPKKRQVSISCLRLHRSVPPKKGVCSFASCCVDPPPPFFPRVMSFIFFLFSIFFFALVW